MTCTDLKKNLKTDTVPDRRFIVALGNFDGVHIAHQKLIGLAVSLRDRLFPDAAVAAWFFSDLPENDLPVPPVGRLIGNDEKNALLRKAGAEYTFAYPFTELRAFSPEDFCNKTLITECHAAGAVCGFNFRFGKNAEGTPEKLESFFPGAFAELPETRIDGMTVSSTAIRESLRNGDTETAKRMLGRPYSLTLPVTHGKHLGTGMGIPTVNQVFPAGALIPRHGVYATVTRIDGKSYPGISNIGVRPTVESSDSVNCETYIFDYSGDLYGKTVTVEFHRFLRDERKFATVRKLHDAIQADIQSVRKMFG